jgi:hypothetical protein
MAAESFTSSTGLSLIHRFLRASKSLLLGRWMPMIYGRASRSDVSLSKVLNEGLSQLTTWEATTLTSVSQFTVEMVLMTHLGAQ